MWQIYVHQPKVPVAQLGTKFDGYEVNVFQGFSPMNQKSSITKTN